MDSENQLRDLLNEITILYTDTLNTDTTQKNKIKNYREGTTKITTAVELLEKLKSDINDIDTQNQATVQMDRTKEFIELLQLPGFRFNEIITTTNMLKKISTGLTTPVTIDNHVELDTMLENKPVKLIDVYEQ
jgi:hypothetical protein